MQKSILAGRNGLSEDVALSRAKAFVQNLGGDAEAVRAGLERMEIS